jgi:hypothetical protein
VGSVVLAGASLEQVDGVGGAVSEVGSGGWLSEGAPVLYQWIVIVSWSVVLDSGCLPLRHWSVFASWSSIFNRSHLPLRLAGISLGP